MEYEVKDIVCDYGVYENGELKLILNNRDNATLIKNVLIADSKHKRFEIKGSDK